MKKSGKLEGGVKLTTGFFCRIDIFPTGVLIIGNHVQINDFCHIACAKSIIIGNDCLIASRVFITDHDHHISNVGEIPNSGNLDVKFVSIGERVWIGEGVSIMKGVSIGNDVIIGANSVVTKNIPDAVIVAGVPARIIKHRIFDANN